MSLGVSKLSQKLEELIKVNEIFFDSLIMNNKNQLFRNNIKTANYKPVLYELLPPPASSSGNNKNAFFQVIDKILSDVKIDAINIPEVRQESGQIKDKGAETFFRKDPRYFAQELLNRRSDIPVIANHVVVHEAPDVFEQWVKQTYEEFGIRNVIFVGGESGKIKYPGPTVNEAAIWVRDIFNKDKSESDKMLIGGITIPTRRRDDPEYDEPARLLRKGQSGIEFFTSQVIYESDSMKSLLSDYDLLCRKSGQTPKRILLSFAPVSTTKDVQFLRWLGVSIPTAVEQRLNEGWIGMGWRSVELCQKILKDILDYVKSNSLKVPIGINVEHVMKYNVELSKELLITLSKILHHDS